MRNYIPISDKYQLHYACEADRGWIEETLGKYNPYYNNREHPFRFGVIFSDRETSTNILWLGLSANSGKLIVTSAVLHPSKRDMGYLEEIGIDAVAWLGSNNENNHQKIVIPVQSDYTPFPGFQEGQVQADGMRADIKVL